MTDVAALKALLAKVEAGEAEGISAGDFGKTRPGGAHFQKAFPCPDGQTTGDVAGLAIHAYRGSLDAAKALHDALLPGWLWRVRNGQSSISATIGCDFLKGQYFEADGKTPARAWLIAILKALIAEAAA